MKKKLTYRFHNPNTEKDTVDIILKVLIEANQNKVEIAIKDDAENYIEKEIKLAV